MNKIQRNIIYISLWFPLAGFAASFDCNKASTSVESLICSNTDISLADEKMASVYAKAKKINPEIVTSQRAWVKQRNVCQDVECLRTAIAERTKILTMMLSNAGQATKTTQPSQSSGTNVWPSDPYKCDDGTSFTIAYITENGQDTPSKAKLTIAKKKIEETLECESVGANAVQCANKNYGYNNFKGEVTLTDNKNSINCIEGQ